VRHQASASVPSVDSAVPVRLLGSPAVLLGGPEGVRAFCDTERFTRRDATPGVVGDVLFGRGAVHGLDGEAHRVRKTLFVEALDADRVDDLVRRVGRSWQWLVDTVPDGQVLDVQRESARLVGRCVLAWAGITIAEQEADQVAQWFADIVDGFAVIGPAHLRARLARRRSDAWSQELVRSVRNGRLVPEPGCPLDLAARWPDERGNLLPVATAAVDLQNMLRPAVAASRFVTFAALALEAHPRWRQRLAEEHARGAAALGDGDRGPQATAFAREVRRLAPFVPLLAARSRRDQEVLGQRLSAEQRVLLDVVGTLRDPLVWPEPMRFSPERFLGSQAIVADALVPQGGGSIIGGHRCPGEDPVLGILACSSTALALVWDGLVGRRRSVDERRMPAAVPGGVHVKVSPAKPWVR
jgi:fatty-acid peroxygenase